ncbi:DnaJ-domain-containing protein [Linderina pennispora]|uniref:DnaJ-domain-containing protein n=1 Tax=Linderina pennispora TaxID=61395 RepID=A0A1Y1W4U0_9FUNG|nr:DnaJ-domain-containing protein [Linderina pennispora]ORX68527.1 DnaJ-domain-containing protein [Linderina pennispora]
MTRPFSDRASERTLTTDTPSDPGSLYVILGVDTAATPGEIKRAYRRLALQYHPDRSPTTSQRFVSIQHAYDILSDERMRRIYDRYGDLGIQMAGRMGGEILDPHVSNLLSALAFVSALVAMLLIVFFALLARRVDMQRPWPFSAVFMPLWTIDGLVLVSVCWAYCLKIETEATRADDDRRSRKPAAPPPMRGTMVMQVRATDQQPGCADEATALLDRQDQRQRDRRIGGGGDAGG